MIEDNQLACLVIQKRSLTKDVYAIDSKTTTDGWMDESYQSIVICVCNKEKWNIRYSKTSLRVIIFHWRKWSVDYSRY